MIFNVELAFPASFVLGIVLRSSIRTGCASAARVSEFRRRKGGRGADRLNNVKKLPGGNLLYVKVATQETGGAVLHDRIADQAAGSWPTEALSRGTGRVVLLSRCRVCSRDRRPTVPAGRR